MRGSTSTKTNIKFFVGREEEDRDGDTTSGLLGIETVRPGRRCQLPKAAVVRLVALSGREREISPPRSQVYDFPA